MATYTWDYGSAASGLHFTIVYDDTTSEFTVTSHTGSFDLNALWISDGNTTSDGYTLVKSDNSLNMNGANTVWEDGTSSSENIVWDTYAKLSTPGLGSAGTNKTSFISNGETHTFTLADFGLTTFDPTDYGTLGVRATSVNGNGSIKWVDAAPEILTGNNPPVITSDGGGDTASIQLGEHSANVTDVTATDEDLGQTLSYTIVGGADADKFMIEFNLDTGAAVLSFANGAVPDFENPTDADGNNVFEVEVQVSDGAGGIDTQLIAVTITDVNEPPRIAGGDQVEISIAENTTAVTTVTATDPDAGQTLTYAILGTDAGLFTIDPDTGVLTFNTPPNFEAPADADANNVYEIDVQAADGQGGITTQQLVVTVTDVNEAPVITSDGGGDTASIQLGEHSANVTDVTATDEDLGQTLSYTIVGGADADKFMIEFNLDTGAAVLSFANGAVPDFENPTDADGNNVFEVEVQVSDGAGGIDTQLIAVTITDVNEPPRIAGGDQVEISIAENTTAVTTVTATDPDAGQTLTYAILGTDAGLFTIDPDTGVLTFNTPPNFEAPADADANNVYEIDVQAADGQGGITTQQLVVTVTDVNEAPVITSDGGGDTASIQLGEHSANVTDVTATDEDLGQTLSYTIVGGADADKFMIEFNLDTGAAVLSFANGAVPDFENPTDADGNNVFEVEVQVSDGAGGIDTQLIAVTITDVNEPPRIAGGDQVEISIAENTTAVTTVTATDPDAGQTLTYAILGTDAGLFTIDPDTGVLTFNTPPNFEAPADADANNVYEIDVQAADGQGGITTQQLVVTVTDVNEAPVITSDGGGDTASIQLGEHSANVTDVTATDEDLGQTLSYTIVGGADADKFMIEFNLDTGAAVLSFANGAVPDFENPTDADGNNVFEVEVQVSDGAGGIDTQLIAVTITDVNEPPRIAGGDQVEISIAENTTAVTTVTATDPDAGQTLTYAILGTDAGLFTIDPDTGVLTFNTPPNFEAPADADANNVYEIDVQAADGQGGITTQQLVVTVSSECDRRHRGAGHGQTLSYTIRRGRCRQVHLIEFNLDTAVGALLCQWPVPDSRTLPTPTATIFEVRSRSLTAPAASNP